MARYINITIAQQLTIAVTGYLMSITVKLYLPTIALKLGKKILWKILLEDTDSCINEKSPGRFNLCPHMGKNYMMSK